MLSVKQYAERVGLSYNTICALCRTGRMGEGCIKVGGSYRIDPEKAEKAMQVQTVEPLRKITSDAIEGDKRAYYKARLKALLD